jgi:hypothetical protein
MSWIPPVIVPVTVVEERVHEHGLEDMVNSLFSGVHDDENEETALQRLSWGFGY